MPNYPLDFLIYSVGKHPKYFLKLVAKYDGVLNPTMVLTSATVYRPSFSSLAASLKRILRMKSMVDSPVIAFNFRCRLERLMFISLANSSVENSMLSMFFSTIAIARFNKASSIALNVIFSGSTSSDLAYFSSIRLRVRIMFCILVVRMASEKGLGI